MAALQPHCRFGSTLCGRTKRSALVELTPPDGVVERRVDEKTGKFVSSGGIKEWFLADTLEDTPTFTAVAQPEQPVATPKKNRRPVSKTPRLYSRESLFRTARAYRRATPVSRAA